MTIRTNLEITGLLAEHGIVVVAFKLVGAQTCSTLTKCYKLKLEIHLQWCVGVSRINILFFNFKSCLRQKIIRITWKKARACSTWPFLISSTPAIPRGCEKQITFVCFGEKIILNEHNFTTIAHISCLSSMVIPPPYQYCCNSQHGHC